MLLSGAPAPSSIATPSQLLHATNLCHPPAALLPAAGWRTARRKVRSTTSHSIAACCSSTRTWQTAPRRWPGWHGSRLASSWLHPSQWRLSGAGGCPVLAAFWVALLLVLGMGTICMLAASALLLACSAQKCVSPETCSMSEMVRACRDYPGFGAAFQQLELEPMVQQPQQQRRGAGHGCNTCGSSGGGGRGPGGGRGRGGGGRRGRRRAAAGSSSEEEEEQAPSSSMGSEEDSDEWGARFAAGLEGSGTEEGESSEGAPAPAPQPARRQRRLRGRGGGVDPATWQRPASHAALVLDQVALRHALKEGGHGAAWACCFVE